MNVSTTKNRVTLHVKERRTIDQCRRLTSQLAAFYESLGQQSAIAKTAATALGELCQQLDGNKVDERQLQEVK